MGECPARLRGRLEASGKHPALLASSGQIDQFDFNGALASPASMAADFDIPQGDP
ncbi:MAG: hypothetical protein ABT940_06520 [Alphaproteobacteria bacterium]